MYFEVVSFCVVLYMFFENFISIGSDCCGFRLLFCEIVSVMKCVFM